MLLSPPPYGLWTIWPYLSWLQRSFLLILFLVSIYCVYTTVLIRLRSKAILKRRELLVLQSRNAALRQMIEAAFYLFGLVLFFGFQFAHWVLADGRWPPEYQIISNYLVHFAFAANVFLIFLLLHSVHWIASARLRSCLLRLDNPHLPPAIDGTSVTSSPALNA
jgi:hypothetical protein